MADYKVTDTQLSQIASAIRTKGGTSDPLVFPNGFVSAIQSISGIGTLISKNIVANGEYEASADSADGYSNVVVSVPMPTGSIGISENGEYDISAYASAVVSVPSAALSDITISQNGSYAASDEGVDGFANVVVNVSGGGSNDNYFVAIGASAGSIYDDVTISVPVNAFLSKASISAVFMPNAETVGQNAFRDCGVSVVSLPKCKTINNYAFCSARLQTASFPECLSIGPAAFQSCSQLVSATFPKCTSMQTFCFSTCSSLQTAEFPSCQTVPASAFMSDVALVSLSFPMCTWISESAFLRCIALPTAIFPQCLAVDRYAFQSCYSLRTISFPVCQSIRANAFAYCSKLSEAIFPSCTELGDYAFSWCRELETIEFPLLTSIAVGGYTFMNCYSLTSVSLPMATKVVQYMFAGCSALSRIELSECTSIEPGAFKDCTSLGFVSFPICTDLRNNAFQNCYNLLSLYLLASSVAKLSGVTVFASTPMSNYTTSTGGVYGSIYVPASLVDAYKSANNWSVYSDRITAYTE